MHDFVGLGHSLTNAVVGSCRDKTRTSEHIGISPAEEGWTAANQNEMYFVAALTCNVFQQPGLLRIAVGHWRDALVRAPHARPCRLCACKPGRLELLVDERPEVAKCTGHPGVEGPQVSRRFCHGRQSLLGS
jgi:hypothetical protein